MGASTASLGEFDCEAKGPPKMGGPSYWGSLVLSHPPSPRLRVPRWQAHPVGEDVLIMGDAIQRERVDVARVRPDGMRLLSHFQDESAVVAVEPGLDAV